MLSSRRCQRLLLNVRRTTLAQTNNATRTVTRVQRRLVTHTAAPRPSTPFAPTVSLWNTFDAPETGLGRYRVLSPLAGVHVSPIQFGAMTIGNKYAALGGTDKESSFALLDAYYEAGGNFIDTANT